MPEPADLLALARRLRRGSRTVVDRRDPRTGRWVRVVDDPDALRVRAGTVDDRRGRDATRLAWEVTCGAGPVSVLATWPVREVVTHRVGELVGRLHDELALAGTTPDEDLDAIEAALRDRDSSPAREGADGPVGLAPHLWFAAYPLLRVPLQRGAVIAEVPPPIELLLREPDPRTGLRRLTARPTRPLVRALAASLLPASAGAPVAFEPAVLALVGAGICGPEQLTDILSTTPHRPGAVALGIGDVDRARRCFTDRRSRWVRDRLCRAIAEPDGVAALLDEVGAWTPPLPPVVPAEAPPARRPAPAPAPPAPAPAPAPPAPTRDPVRHPPALAALAGRRIGDHELVLPATGDDLIGWGRELDNCLGSYRFAVAEGRSRLVGLRRAGRLEYVVELTPGGTVRQFEGRSNRQAPAAVAGPVLAELRRAGLALSDGRSGRPLLAPRRG